MIAGPTYASNPIDSHRAQIARYFVKDYCLYRPRPCPAPATTVITENAASVRISVIERVRKRVELGHGGVARGRYGRFAR